MILVVAFSYRRTRGTSFASRRVARVYREFSVQAQGPRDFFSTSRSLLQQGAPCHHLTFVFAKPGSWVGPCKVLLQKSFYTFHPSGKVRLVF